MLSLQLLPKYIVFLFESEFHIEFAIQFSNTYPHARPAKAATVHQLLSENSVTHLMFRTTYHYYICTSMSYHCRIDGNMPRGVSGL